MDLVNARKRIYDLERELNAVRSAIVLSDEMLKFLRGEGPLDGVWFGDKHPKYPGSFWWRAWLRRSDSGRTDA